MRQPHVAPLRLAAVIALAHLLAGCGNEPPDFTPLSDQVAIVEQELALTLYAADPEGFSVVFTFVAADLPNLGARASIHPVRPGEAVFRWTPVMADLGRHAFDFVADDGQLQTSQTIVIEVKIEEGGGTGPTFVQPVGAGMTIDLSQRDCGSFLVVVEDPDSATVAISQAEPLIGGAVLAPGTGLTAQWSWCPTAAQIAGIDRVMLYLSAADDSHQVVKDYLIALRKPQKTNCPGAYPVIVADAGTNPPAVTTLLPLVFHADVSDDQGIKSEPLLYYSLTDPGTPPDVGRMAQATMTLDNGGMTSGRWLAEVPNPVVNLPVGASADVWYVIAAQDNDDALGDCDHLTQAPAAGSYRQRVTRPADEAGRGPCASCTADVQCGGPADNCLGIGDGSESFCFKACASDSDCGDPLYYCSLTPWISVDGAAAHQCIPLTYRCPPEPACVDDAYEPNDSLSQAAAASPIPDGTLFGLRLCLVDSVLDEDWYHVQVAADTQVTASVAGSSPPDVDLALQDASGAVVAASTSLSANESLSACVPAGDYYLRVHGYGAQAADYSLTYSAAPTTCAACAADWSEPDDDATQARPVSLITAYWSNANTICPGNDDWFEVELVAGQELYATLAFTQLGADQDLDLRLYQRLGGSVVDLTQCTETAPTGCSSTNGQSSTSNENLAFTVTSDGTYFVVVHGWGGAANQYDICIATSNAAGWGCPPLAK